MRSANGGCRILFFGPSLIWRLTLLQRFDMVANPNRLAVVRVQWSIRPSPLPVKIPTARHRGGDTGC